MTRLYIVNKYRVLPVVMAGSCSTPLRPLSRAGYPKQFLLLSGGQSLLQQAAECLAWLACNVGEADIVRFEDTYGRP